MSKAFFAVLAISTGMLGKGFSQDYTYTLSTGDPNVFASITLDAPYSPASGGTINDVLDFWGELPLSNGQMVGFNYDGSLDPFAEDPSISVSSLVWNPFGISSLSIKYIPEAPQFENWTVTGGSIYGFDPNGGFTGVPPYITTVTGDGGTWEPAFTTTPEPSTVWLLLAGTGLFLCSRRFLSVGK